LIRYGQISKEMAGSACEHELEGRIDLARMRIKLVM